MESSTPSRRHIRRAWWHRVLRMRLSLSLFVGCGQVTRWSTRYTAAGGRTVRAVCRGLLSSLFAARGYGENRMESETGPEEGGSTPGSWILVVSPGLHEGGALGPTSLVGAAEAMQAPGGVPGEEAVLFWVEEGAALEEGEVAAIGQELDRIRRC